MNNSSRRGFIRHTVHLGTGVLFGWPWLCEDVVTLLSPAIDFVSKYEYLGNLEFVDRRRDDRPRERVYSNGLSGRFRQDLTRLNAETLITPNERFFIRTRVPAKIDYDSPWHVRIARNDHRVAELPVSELESIAQPQGTVLLECSGNGLGGLISAARWDGVAFDDVLKHAGVSPSGPRVLVSGFDDHDPETYGFSRPGASWIFTLEQLRSAGAFFATKMNGKPLSRDHGYPLRLIVPGWYGCTCIKWVNEIRFVDDDAPATSQMREFAGRTLQTARHELARAYAPAVIDLAAMPVRVEHWRTCGKPFYRIFGIIWGGDRLVDRLLIQFKPDAPFMDVEQFQHTTNRTWQLWSHTWRPDKPGRYTIRLKVNEPDIPTRKMDRDVYTRSVQVTDV